MNSRGPTPLQNGLGGYDIITIQKYIPGIHRILHQTEKKNNKMKNHQATDQGDQSPDASPVSQPFNLWPNS